MSLEEHTYHVHVGARSQNSLNRVGVSFLARPVKWRIPFEDRHKPQQEQQRTSNQCHAEQQPPILLVRTRTSPRSPRIKSKNQHIKVFRQDASVRKIIMNISDASDRKLQKPVEIRDNTNYLIRGYIIEYPQRTTSPSLTTASTFLCSLLQVSALFPAIWQASLSLTRMDHACRCFLLL